MMAGIPGSRRWISAQIMVLTLTVGPTLGCSDASSPTGVIADEPDDSQSAAAYGIERTLSDGGQRNTIAFDGLAFLTGNLGSQSFLPPGKVERPIRFLRESFFYGRTFTSDSDLNHQAQHWLATVANVRTHATHKQRPIDRFAEEKDQLRPLASRPYRSLVLSQPASPAPERRPSVPRILVQRRPLEQYA